MSFAIQPHRFRLIPVLLIALFASTGVLAQGPGTGKVTGQPRFQFSTTATQPIIEYTLVHRMLENQDPVPLLRIYGDGRVHTHIPVYMKNAGDYEYRLSQPELKALLRSLSQDGMMDFDDASAKTEKKQMEDQERNAGVLHAISDTTETLIEIRLNEYQRNPAAGRIMGFNKRFTWDNLEQDASQYPQSGAIKSAADGARRLHLMLEHPGMQRVK